jgi:hypothetical protein
MWEVEPRLSSPSAPARMMKILEAEGGAEAATRLASPPPNWWSSSWMTIGEGMQPGCMMKILEDERWLKGADPHEVALLQQQQDEGNADSPHPGARKVEGRDA